MNLREMRYTSRSTKENGRPSQRKGYSRFSFRLRALKGLYRSNRTRMEKLVGRLDELYRRLEMVGVKSKR